MGVISLKFGTEDFSSLCVNDYVYYVESGTFFDYNLAKTEAKLLGPVKQINKSVPLLVRSFTLDRDHYTQFTITGASLGNPNGFNKLNTKFNVSSVDASTISSATSFTLAGNVAKVGDVVSFTSPGALTSITRTIASFEKIGDELFYVLNSNIGSTTYTNNINFTTTSPTRLKIFTSDTELFSQGLFASGASLPGGSTPTATVTNVVEDISITLDNPAITSGSSTVTLTFSGDNTVTPKPFEVLIHVDDNDVTLPVHSNNPYYFFVKDTSVNTSGLLGYFADVKLSNNSLTKAELFSIGSEIFESSK